MDTSKNIFITLNLILCLFAIAGCQSSSSGNAGQMQSYSFSNTEPDWIKVGEPIVFEKEQWFPKDNIEILTDGEMIMSGEYRGAQYFIEKQDVRPYQRLYTKFGRNQFRVFEK